MNGQENWRENLVDDVEGLRRLLAETRRIAVLGIRSELYADRPAHFVPAYLADALTGNGMEFFAPWKSHLLAGVIMFVLTFLLFTAKVIGAGDSKLCSAFALWVGVSGLASYLFYMAILGALLGIATKLLQGRQLVPAAKEGSWIAKSQSGGNGVPYGIAICFGAIVAFYALGYFSPEKLALLAGYTENQP